MKKEELKLKYDEQCKKILSYPRILAYILKACVSEYNNLTIEEIENLIEKDDKSNIKFNNVEDISINNHKIVYDIFFRSRLPNNTKIGVLIDLESQSNINNGYDLINRAITYSSCLFVSQTKKKYIYRNLDKVYSIWICSDTRNNSKTDIFVYKTKRDSLFHSKRLVEDYELINIVCIYLGKDIDELMFSGTSSPYIDMLKILKSTITRNAKLEDSNTLKMLKKDYNIIIEKEDIKNMCNFADAFEYDCIQQGMQQGIINNAVNNINNLINNLNVSYDKAINILGIDESIRKEVLQSYKKKYKN